MFQAKVDSSSQGIASSQRHIENWTNRTMLCLYNTWKIHLWGNPMTETRPLRVFLCHASQDKPAVRELYKRLAVEKWIDPWLDEEKILPGQDWNFEIEKALLNADLMLVCLSKESVAKEGYVQREFKRVFTMAEEKPEGTIYVIPLRLDDCVPPSKFKQWQWVDYFNPLVHEKLIKSLRLRADALKIETSDQG